MLLLEAVREFLDRDGLPISIAFGGGVIAIPGGGDDADRTGARLLAGEHGARSQADAATVVRSAACAVQTRAARCPR